MKKSLEEQLRALLDTEFGFTPTYFDIALAAANIGASIERDACEWIAGDRACMWAREAELATDKSAIKEARNCQHEALAVGRLIRERGSK